MKNGKRIHKVVIKRMMDDSPDTSYLGEYANHPTSEFSIDRAHDLDCYVNAGKPETICTEHLNQRQDGCDDCDTEWEQQAGACCVQGGQWGGREYRYFNPSFNYVDKAGRALPENTSADVRKYMLQDYARMESAQRGDWCYLGIRAEAEILIYADECRDVIQNITSGGLWGIESDLDAKYLAEIEQEQLAELREQLAAIGFSKRAISIAFRNIERRDV